MDGILKDGYGLMPTVILKDRALSSTAKLVYVLISSLCAKEGYCYASNKYIGEELDLSERQVRDCLTQLAPYLEFENRDSHKRRLFLAGKAEENRRERGEKLPGQPGEKPPHNNISINNINQQDKPITAAPSAWTETDVKLTDLLYELVTKNFPYVKLKQEAKAYQEMNRIHRIDGYPYEVIKAVILWSQQDNFWSQNIRSVAKLRKQFGTLLIRAKSDMGRGSKVVKI